MSVNAEFIDRNVATDNINTTTVNILTLQFSLQTRFLRQFRKRLRLDAIEYKAVYRRAVSTHGIQHERRLKSRNFRLRAKHFLQLWERLRSLPIHINFDTANAYALKDWKRILNAVAGRIATVHINDLASVEPLAFCLAGDGIVPMEEILNAVYATGFRGDICLEEAAFQGWDGIERAVAYTLDLCRKYGFDK